MPEALAALKRELGPEAVILRTRTLPAGDVQPGTRRPRVEITASLPGTPKPVGQPFLAASRQGAEGGGQGCPPHSELYRCYVRLVQNDVAEELAGRLVRQAAAHVSGGSAQGKFALSDVVRDYIARMIPAAPTVDWKPGTARRVALVGPSGAGKTTTLAKLAALFRLRHGKRVALLSLDMQRLDAHTHLRCYAGVLCIPLHTAQTVAEVERALASLGAVDVLLIDTPGVGPREQARFARMAALLRAASPDEIHLVLPASLDPKVQARIAHGFAPLGIAKVVLTKLDEVVGLGVILNVVERLGLGVSYTTSGQNVPNDIQEACGSRVAQLVFAADE